MQNGRIRGIKAQSQANQIWFSNFIWEKVCLFCKMGIRKFFISAHQKKTLIDLRLISKPPFSEETAWHQGFYWGPPPYLAIGHQAPGKVAQIGRWGRGISLSPSDWRISPNLMALWTKVSKGEGILLFIRLRLKRQSCFLLFC